jgi:hypothetical protein
VETGGAHQWSRIKKTVLISGFRLLGRKLFECVDDFMRVLCDINVREDLGDLAFSVDYERHPFCFRTILA